VTDAAAPLALLAGASRGLGLAMAHELGSRGYRLAICARDERELDRAADDLRRRGHQVHTEVVDVADRDGVTRWVSDVEEEVGAIEVMICVAGIIQVGPVGRSRPVTVRFPIGPVASPIFHDDLGLNTDRGASSG
jgi:NADP-dependent 3-hydroxy acid dehydrogenase YdfG